MDELAVSAMAAKASQDQRTRASQFLMRRGVLLMKEFRTVGTMRDLYGAKLEFQTVIMTVAKSATNPEENSFSLKLEYHREHSEATALVDFDEIDEIDRALVFIERSAAKINGQRRDYTELLYSTRDGLVFGFYQETNTNQTFFIRLSNHESFFLDMVEIPKLRGVLKAATDHLTSKGAGRDRHGS